MGQYDVIEFLKKHPRKWYSVEEIAAKAHFTRQSVQNAIVKLKRFGIIDMKEIMVGCIHRNGKRPVYHYKIMARQ